MSSSHRAEARASVLELLPPKLLDQVRARMRRRGLAKRTEEAYVGWIRRFILARVKRHPRDMGGPEVKRFLTGLAAGAHMSSGTQ